MSKRPRQSARDRIQRLAIALADADSEDDRQYELAWDSLRHAFEAWNRSLHARRNALRRWNKATTEEKQANAKRAAAARWKGMHASTHTHARHDEKQAGEGSTAEAGTKTAEQEKCGDSGAEKGKEAS